MPNGTDWNIAPQYSSRPVFAEGSSGWNFFYLPTAPRPYSTQQEYPNSPVLAGLYDFILNPQYYSPGGQ